MGPRVLNLKKKNRKISKKKREHQVKLVNTRSVSEFFSVLYQRLKYTPLSSFLKVTFAFSRKKNDVKVKVQKRIVCGLRIALVTIVIKIFFISLLVTPPWRDLCLKNSELCNIASSSSSKLTFDSSDFPLNSTLSRKVSLNSTFCNLPLNMLDDSTQTS